MSDALVGLMESAQHHQVRQHQHPQPHLHHSPQIPVHVLTDLPSGFESADDLLGGSPDQHRSEMVTRHRIGRVGNTIPDLLTELGAEELLEMARDNVHLRILLKRLDLKGKPSVGP